MPFVSDLVRLTPGITCGREAADGCKRLLCRVFLNSRLTSFEKLDSVPEGIEHVDTVKAFEGFVRDRRKSGSPTAICEFCKAAHQDGRVCLAGWSEVRIYTEMKTQRAPAKPCAAALRELRGL
jgi:hypothetical protein